MNFYFPNRSEVCTNKSEILRYLGYSKKSIVDNATSELIDSYAEELKKSITPKCVYETFDLSVSENNITFADINLCSEDLKNNFTIPNSKKTCTKVTLFAATLGMKCDAEIKKATKLDPLKAAIFQATGAMLIEETVEMLCEKIKSEAALENFFCRPRYSPGYGDVPLSVQKYFFKLLDTQKIGLSLMDTLIMAPEKSVTAFVGWHKI